MVASSLTPMLKKTGVMENVIIGEVEVLVMEDDALLGGRTGITESAGTGSITLRAHRDPVTRGRGTA